MEDNLKKNEKNGRRPKKKMKKKWRQPKKMNGKRPKQKWKTHQSTKINLIGCDTIVNSPSLKLFRVGGNKVVKKLAQSN